jgi:hypothetical protein
LAGRLLQASRTGAPTSEPPETSGASLTAVATSWLGAHPHAAHPCSHTGSVAAVPGSITRSSPGQRSQSLSRHVGRPLAAKGLPPERRLARPKPRGPVPNRGLHRLPPDGIKAGNDDATLAGARLAPGRRDGPGCL